MSLATKQTEQIPEIFLVGRHKKVPLIGPSSKLVLEFFLFFIFVTMLRGQMCVWMGVRFVLRLSHRQIPRNIFLA